MLTTTSAIFVIASFLFIVALMLVFSFRETLGGLFEFWEVKKTLRFFRRVHTWRSQADKMAGLEGNSRT